MQSSSRADCESISPPGCTTLIIRNDCGRSYGMSRSRSRCTDSDAMGSRCGWIPRGPVVELYGPARRGMQTGPLRGIIVGGRNAALLDTARRVLHDRFTGYHVADERVRLGFHPDNPVNLPSQHGIQIELPPGLRGIGDFGEHLEPGQSGMVVETMAALVELSHRAGELIRPSRVS